MAANFVFSFKMDEATFELTFFDMSYATREADLRSRLRRSHYRETTERISGAALQAIGDCLANRGVLAAMPTEAEG